MGERPVGQTISHRGPGVCRGSRAFLCLSAPLIHVCLHGWDVCRPFQMPKVHSKLFTDLLAK